MGVFKMILKVIGFLFLGLIATMGIFAMWAFSYHKKIKADVVKNVDLSKVKDGEYEAIYPAKMWSKKVNLVVKDHKIADIKMSAVGKIPVADVENQLLARVIKNQSLDVDAIAGSTITTRVILKSAQLALEKGLE